MSFPSSISSVEVIEHAARVLLPRSYPLSLIMSVGAMALPKPFEHKADVFDYGCAHDSNFDAMGFPTLPNVPHFPESR